MVRHVTSKHPSLSPSQHQTRVHAYPPSSDQSLEHMPSNHPPRASSTSPPATLSPQPVPPAASPSLLFSYTCPTRSTDPRRTNTRSRTHPHRTRQTSVRFSAARLPSSESCNPTLSLDVQSCTRSTAFRYRSLGRQSRARRARARAPARASPPSSFSLTHARTRARAQDGLSEIDASPGTDASGRPRWMAFAGGRFCTGKQYKNRARFACVFPPKTRHI